VPGTDKDDRGFSAGRRRRPEKMTGLLAMRVSSPWEVPAGISEVMRQEPTKLWPVAVGVLVCASVRNCLEPTTADVTATIATSIERRRMGLPQPTFR
jgi:hypothetical protein